MPTDSTFRRTRCSAAASSTWADFGKLTVTAGRQVFIENHCGILEYGTERICVAFDRGRVVINGAGLELVAMSGRELIIKGRLHSLEWE